MGGVLLGQHRLRYEEGWRESPAGRALSPPFTPGNLPHRGSVVEDYFDNLLPDSDAIRQRMRDRFTAASSRTFDLLQAVGRDCAGAVQLPPPGQRPTGTRRIESDALDDSGMEREIASVERHARDRPASAVGLADHRPRAEHIDWHKAKLAMAVRGRNAHGRLADIQPRHWDAAALRKEIVESVPQVLDSVAAQLPRGFPARVADAIFKGVREGAVRLAR